MSTKLTTDSTVLVTGGSGFLGGHLIRALLDRGCRVRVADLRPSTTSERSGVEFVPVDLTDPQAAARACEGTSTVIHLAGNPSGTKSVEAPLWDFAVNASATTNICHAAVTEGVSRLVYVSSGMVYGVPEATPISEAHPVKPFLPYAASKLSAELSVQAASQTYGLNASIARPFTLYGPGEDPKTSGGEVGQFLRWHLNGMPIRITGNPNLKTRDFTYVDDAVAALLSIVEFGRNGAAYNVGTGAETSLADLVAIIEQVTGTLSVTDINSDVTEDTYRHVADISALRGLGYSPTTALHDGVARLAADLGNAPEIPSLPTIFTTKRPVEEVR